MLVQHLHAFALPDLLSLGEVVFQVPVGAVEQCPLRGGGCDGRILHEVALLVVGADCEVVAQDGYEYHVVIALLVLQDELCGLLQEIQFPCLQER